MGLQSTRLHHRLSEKRSGAENLYSEPIDISVADTVFTLPPKHSELILLDNTGLPGVKVGTAYIADDGRLVNPETGKDIVCFFHLEKFGFSYITLTSMIFSLPQVPQPMDFSKKNYISMMDLQDLLIKLVRPDIEVSLRSPILSLN